MVINLIRAISDSFLTRLERFSVSRFWIMKAVIIIFFTTLIYSFHNYYNVVKLTVAEQHLAFENIVSKPVFTSKTDDTSGLGHPTTLEFVQRQINDPFTLVPSSENWRYRHTQGLSRQFRLTMPVLGHLLHLNVLWLIVIQLVMGIIFIGLTILFVTSITNDRVLGLLFALGFGFTYLGKACLIDVRPWLDGIAYFFLFIAMFSKKPSVAGICIFLAAFTDERAVVASGFVFLWWKIQNYKISNISVKNLLKPDGHSVFILSAIILYFSIRLLLVNHFGFVALKPDMNIVMMDIKNNLNNFPFETLTGVKWFILFSLLALILMIRLKFYLPAALFMGIHFVIYFLAFIDSDITKTVTYVFPAIFISLWFFISQGESIKNLRYLVLGIVVLCFMMASISIPFA